MKYFVTKKLNYSSDFYKFFWINKICWICNKLGKGCWLCSFFDKDVDLYEYTHKKAGEYYSKIRIKHNKDKLSKEMICLIFVSELHIDTDIFCMYHKENYIYLRAVLKSKPFVKVCFFLLLNKPRTPPSLI